MSQWITRRRKASQGIPLKEVLTYWKAFNCRDSAQVKFRKVLDVQLLNPRSYRKSPTLRRTQAMWANPRVWRPRLIFWAGALIIGLISVIFAKLADMAQTQFHSLTQQGGRTGYLPLVITPMGFVVCAYVAMRYFPNSQGSGIPQAIAARHLTDDDERERLLSLKMAAGKIILTVIGLFSGASIGREGPTVQVGASIMLQAARWGGMAHARGLILAGSAAGIAAAFNTPLAGVVFPIEEMGKSYESRANGLVLTAVILSGLAALGLVGNYTYFGEFAAARTAFSDWPLILVCGIGGGACGAMFSVLALKASRRIRQWTTAAPCAQDVAAGRRLWVGCGADLQPLREEAPQAYRSAIYR